MKQGRASNVGWGIFLLFLLRLTGAASASPLVSIEPAVTLVDPDDLFEVALYIDDGVDTISNFQVRFDFPTGLLQFQEAIEGSLYTASGNQTWFYFDESPPGTVEVFDVIFPAMSFVLPPGELARLRFRALAEGVAEIRFLSVDLRDILRDPIPGVLTRGGSVCIGTGTTGLDSPRPDRPEWMLAPPSPNPARGGTRIRLFRPPASAGMSCRLGLFDPRGRLVRSLEGPAGSGFAELFWDGRNERGDAASPGVYFVRLETPNRTLSRKVIVVR